MHRNHLADFLVMICTIQKLRDLLQPLGLCIFQSPKSTINDKSVSFQASLAGKNFKLLRRVLNAIWKWVLI